MSCSERDEVIFRRRYIAQGRVQGVGFRPFVHRTATALGLTGCVKNTGAGVEIEVQGTQSRLDTFRFALESRAPAAANLYSLGEESLLVVFGETLFEIRDSAPGESTAVALPLDLATCADCVRELFEPSDRRYHYPFLNCTACGPRFTVLVALPYDRRATTMSRFLLCAQCASEYSNPLDRRFHAQPTACAVCGPRLLAYDARGGVREEGAAALALAIDVLATGGVVAAKGLGGFHLLTDAGCSPAVERLRHAKHRPSKPFAVMMPSLEAARASCILSPEEVALLRSPAAPIVLADRCPTTSGAWPIAPQVAPGLPWLGVMLPYTPLHHLLCRPLARPLVATSGNASGAPLIADDRAAIEQLGPSVDLVLGHDRPIARPLDDSVVRVVRGHAVWMRLGRGCAPATVPLPRWAQGGVDALAAGGHIKNSVALSLGARAVLGGHVGDLDHPEARMRHEQSRDELVALLGATPRRVLVDLHPDYAATRSERAWAEGRSTPVAEVQHHEAHAWTALVTARDAETWGSDDAPVLALTWDGTGLGRPQSGVAAAPSMIGADIWGGEAFLFHRGSLHRVASLLPFPLPGGERAAREPWRAWMGVAWVLEGLTAVANNQKAAELGPGERHALVRALEVGGPLAPRCSSLGRLFDAVASALDLCHHARHEAEAAMAVEACADGAPVGMPSGWPVRLELEGDLVRVDWRPAIIALAARRDRGEEQNALAARFHAWLGEVAAALATRAGCTRVVLGGGCFQNARLLREVHAALRAIGCEVALPTVVPPNDGGLALGQLVGGREPSAGKSAV